MTTPDPLAAAEALPNGARFYRCALQVNPYEYLARHSKPTTFASEEAYNEAIVRACLDNEIEVIGVTDHFRVRSAEALARTARAAGLHVFPGFEAVTKDGVHMLCLFEPQRDFGSLERVIGECGVHEDGSPSPTGHYDVLELLQACERWPGLCIAAHVAAKDGLLQKLSGQARMNAWRSARLLACALAGAVPGAPDGLRPILENKNPEHKRDRPVAVLNAQDVQSPEDLLKPGSSCWIKMSEVSLEGLRQAFLDPISRIRLASDEKPTPHSELVAIAWESGFLDGAAFHFNENLNVLIGGRGSGKSTVIESIRTVLGLEPIGDEAKKAHDSLVRQVLGSGTKVSLLVRTHRPKTRMYRMERTIPNPVVVRDEDGQVVTLRASDIVPRAEVYGQHEIAELAKSPEKLTRLLERFAARDVADAQRKAEIVRELSRSRARVGELRNELGHGNERLSSLPALEETLRAFQEAGLEERLQERSLLVREERVLATVGERIAPFEQLLDRLRHELPIDRAFLAPKAIEELPGKETLLKADAALQGLEDGMKKVGLVSRICG
jgi:DNA-binding HxlR family transcriptional regulator